jgi:hypothetical protein
LRLDRSSGDEFNILADLHYPLSDVPCCFFALDDMRQWMIRYDSNNVDQEVMLELPGRHEYCLKQLLYLRVPCLSIF